MENEVITGNKVTKCSSLGCDGTPSEVLELRDQPGHVHDCSQCAAGVREWCDVIKSAPLLPDGTCPWRCTVLPIHTSTPTFL